MFTKLKSKFVCAVQKVKNVAVVAVGGVVATVGLCVPAFAEDATTTSVASSMSTAFGGIQTDMLAVIAVIAPIGIAIFAAFFLWKKGLKFFNSVSGK